MKSKLCCLMPSFFCLCAWSQEIDVSNVFKITAINPGLSWENRIGKLQTIYVQAFINPTAYYDDEPALGTKPLKLTADPAVTLHYRYYFNGKIRKNNGKRIEMNSMNYIALISEVISTRAPINGDDFEEDERRPVTSFGFCWGMQRNYASHFTLDLYLGLGYQFGNGTHYDNTTQTLQQGNSGKLAVLGQFNIGGWFGRKKSK